MKAFSVDLATFPAGKSDSLIEARPDEIGLDPGQWGEQVVGRLKLEKNGDQVTIRGTLEAEARLECVLCLAPARLDLRVPFEVFAERSGGRRKGEEAELERDDYMLFHDGRRLDLGEEAREALLLEVPIAPKCRPDCRGLCPKCGADLNQGPCGCASRADERPETPTG